MPSRTIRPTQAPEPAPFAYTVGTAEGLAPQAVFASWDGTGAGGDFLPCVSFYSSEGVLLDRAFPTTGAVTAGDTAEVSYRPFDRGGGGGGSGGTITLADNFTSVSGVDTIVTDEPMVVSNLGGGNAGLNYQPPYARGVCGGTAVLAPQTLAITTQGLLNVTPHPTSWVVDVAGTYMIAIDAQMQLAGAFGPGVSAAINFSRPGPGGGGRIQFQPAPAVPAGQTLVLDGGFSMLVQCNAGDTFTVLATSNVGGTAFTVGYVLLTLLFLFP